MRWSLLFIAPLFIVCALANIWDPLDVVLEARIGIPSTRILRLKPAELGKKLVDWMRKARKPGTTLEHKVELQEVKGYVNIHQNDGKRTPWKVIQALKRIANHKANLDFTSKEANARKAEIVAAGMKGETPNPPQSSEAKRLDREVKEYIIGHWEQSQGTRRIMEKVLRGSGLPTPKKSFTEFATDLYRAAGVDVSSKFNSPQPSNDHSPKSTKGEAASTKKGKTARPESSKSGDKPDKQKRKKSSPFKFLRRTRSKIKDNPDDGSSCGLSKRGMQNRCFAGAGKHSAQSLPRSSKTKSNNPAQGASLPLKSSRGAVSRVAGTGKPSQPNANGKSRKTASGPSLQKARKTGSTRTRASPSRRPPSSNKAVSNLSARPAASRGGKGGRVPAPPGRVSNAKGRTTSSTTSLRRSKTKNIPSKSPSNAQSHSSSRSTTRRKPVAQANKGARSSSKISPKPKMKLATRPSTSPRRPPQSTRKPTPGHLSRSTAGRGSKGARTPAKGVKGSQAIRKGTSKPASNIPTRPSKARSTSRTTPSRAPSTGRSRSSTRSSTKAPSQKKGFNVKSNVSSQANRRPNTKGSAYSRKSPQPVKKLTTPRPPSARGTRGVKASGPRTQAKSVKGSGSKAKVTSKTPSKTSRTPSRAKSPLRSPLRSPSAGRPRTTDSRSPRATSKKASNPKAKSAPQAKPNLTKAKASSRAPSKMQATRSKVKTATRSPSPSPADARSRAPATRPPNATNKKVSNAKSRTPQAKPKPIANRPATPRTSTVSNKKITPARTPKSNGQPARIPARAPTRGPATKGKSAPKSPSKASPGPAKAKSAPRAPSRSPLASPSRPQARPQAKVAGKPQVKAAPRSIAPQKKV